MVMDVTWSRLYVSMILGMVINMFCVGQGCDE